MIAMCLSDAAPIEVRAPDWPRSRARRVVSKSARGPDGEHESERSSNTFYHLPRAVRHLAVQCLLGRSRCAWPDLNRSTCCPGASRSRWCEWGHRLFAARMHECPRLFVHIFLCYQHGVSRRIGGGAWQALAWRLADAY